MAAVCSRRGYGRLFFVESGSWTDPAVWLSAASVLERTFVGQGADAAQVTIRGGFWQ